MKYILHFYLCFISSCILSQGKEADVDNCIRKVMMRKETRYEESVRCDHEYEDVCHESYVTVFKPQQEEICSEEFKKVCSISYEDRAINKVVEECRTSFVPDYDAPGEKECQNVYETICETVHHEHEVEDDVVECETIQARNCNENQCATVPQEKCRIQKKVVKKATPKTSCRKEERSVCSSDGFSMKQVDYLIIKDLNICL